MMLLVTVVLSFASRFRGSQSATSGGCFSRQGALWTHLLQPGRVVLKADTSGNARSLKQLQAFGWHVDPDFATWGPLLQTVPVTTKVDV